VNGRLRAIPDGFCAAKLAEIDARLRTIQEEHRVAIGFAIESGSRAWGFPSPDSDYDCRFVFVRPGAHYLTPWPKRDVIEAPLEGELDINGWDLPKALKLLLKGNAVMVEWLMSPIVYDGDPGFRDSLAKLAGDHADREALSRHYIHLGRRQQATYFADGKDVRLKKLFYALRPAAALRWLRLRPDAKLAPMHFPTLMAECDAPEAVRALTAQLIARKAVTRELGSGPLPAAIVEFIDFEFRLAEETAPVEPRPLSPQAKAEAEAFFRKWVERLGSTSPR
jgi:predicted nucleotidyltransferase